MKTYIKLLFATVALLTLTNCDKKENKNTTYRWDGINCLSNDNGQVVTQSLCTGQVGVTNTEYYMNNVGQCISRYTGAIAPSNLYCQNNNNGYQLIGGRCFVQSTGQEVAVTLCQNIGGVSQPCFGTFSYPYGGTNLTVICQGQYGYIQTYNQQVQCSGATLYTASGQAIICQ